MAKAGEETRGMIAGGIRQYSGGSETGQHHQKTRMEIPAPHFITFYNGTAKRPERQIYKLSDAFSSEEEEPELELKVTVININPGCNSELLKKCESLSGYMARLASV
jgi:hypothetical protein